MRKLFSWLTLATLGACAAGTGDAAGTSEPATTGAPSSAPSPNSGDAPAAATTAIPTTTTTITTAIPTTTTTITTAIPTTTTSTPPTPPPALTLGSRGDSLMLGVVPPLQGALEQSGYSFQSQWFVGFVDPLAEERWAIPAADAPDVLIVLFAPWELAALLTRNLVDLGDPGWPAVYVSEFVEPRLAELRASGTQAIWVGLPASGDPAESIQYEFLNSIWRHVADAEPSITWLDGASLLAGPDGGYVELDESVSPPVRLFQADGRHLCPEGARRLADGVLVLLEERFGVVVDPAWTESGWEYNPFAYGVGNCPGNE